MLVAVFMHHNLFLVTLILFDKCRKITAICQIKCEKVRKTTEFSSPHNPEVVGSSPASATKMPPNSSELGGFSYALRT